MPLDHARDVVSEDLEDDDMPPLVDHDGSPTYTFSPGMTPLSFASTSAPTATLDTSPHLSPSFISSPPTTPITPNSFAHRFAMSTTQSRPHGKRRDPSYIPRPPNAFILFRCAFIKEQNVPGKVEGNHSRLSKIIGLCWKQLPPEEREKWEAKAVVAQAEHRANYPDWRFRPGANALAKLKVKAKDGGGATATRRRSVRGCAKDTPSEEADDKQPVASDSKGKIKDKGKTKTKVIRHTVSLEETRCAKIAGFVAEGIKGEELEVAVKQWEGDHIIPSATPAIQSTKSKGRGSRASSTAHIRSQSDILVIPTTSSQAATKLSYESSKAATVFIQRTSARAADINGNHDPSSSTDRPRGVVESASALSSNVPLTQMFKRSLSAPAPDNRTPAPHPSSSDPPESPTDDLSSTSAEPSPGVWGSQSTLVGTHNHKQRNTVSFPITSTDSRDVYDSPRQFTWPGEGRERDRIEEVQAPNLWWSQNSSAIDESQFDYETPRDSPINVSNNDMGYEIPADGNEFEQNYLEHYGSFQTSQNGSQQVKWTNAMSSSQNRQGLTVVLEDPYKDDCGTHNGQVDSPSSLSLPPLSSSSYFFSPVSPDGSFPSASSSFSTLTGWAGEYKHDMSDSAAWPDAMDSADSTSSNLWYANENTSTWGTPPQLQHTQVSHEADDWARLEYRAANNLHLPVEPRRQLSFQDELRRANSNTS